MRNPSSLHNSVVKKFCSAFKMMSKYFIHPIPKHSKAKCFVHGCKFEKYDRHDPDRKYISTFHIPKKREVFEKWVQCCGRMDLLDVPIESLQRTLYICELHFTTLHGGIKRKRISNETIPTSFQKGHTPLSEEAMNAWRSTEHYKQYWSAFEKKVTPSNNVQRCPNLPKNSTAIYCQSTGPFPCLYCETVHQPTQALDPDLLDLVPDLPAPSVAAIALSSSPTNQDTKPPLQEAVGKSLFNVVKNYFEQNETEDRKSSQKVVVIKCAETPKREEENPDTNPENEDKKLIVVKISSPESQVKQESTLPHNHANLLEVLSDYTESSATEICELPSAESSKVLKKQKTPIPSKRSHSIKITRPKAEKPIYHNFKFVRSIIPIPPSYQKFCGKTVVNNQTPLNSQPLERVSNENPSSKEIKAIEPTQNTEEMASASQNKKQKLL
ncbi:uncharacterized protein LOC113218304 isoform X1 [Frankliniella occidentalis]|uniref:Uncharacterized protein LOC113218304 isoform X1 n=2 Tax=Frankliniella occidentalis TaxID=133901 RepID=A0A6J1TLK1_FRAOC|nr:uncharacterized protein LOC113218304 isoform X1 [Frankliniella occidentalis]